MNDLVVKIFKYLGWILYLGLFLTAILFTREAMEKFFSGDTGITLSEEKIDLQHPTITICFKVRVREREFFRYGTDFNITFVVKSEDYKNIDNFTLSIGENDLKMSSTKVYLQEMYTYFSGVCYSIRAMRKTDKKYIRLHIWNNAKPLPSISVHFTSKENSYGITYGSFKDGNVESFDLSNGKYKYVELILKKRIHLKCSHKSFYENLGSKIMESDFNNCSSTCIPIFIPNVEYPLCPYDKFKEWYQNNCTECDCSANIIQDIMQNIERNDDHLPFCHMARYKVYNDLESVLYNHNNIRLEYRFATMKTEVYKQYLIYDVIGMVGLVGGTLGLFIGFSFSNVSMFLIEYLKFKTLMTFFRKPNEVDNIQVLQKGSSEKQWEQKFATIETDLRELRQKCDEDHKNLAKLMQLYDNHWYQQSKF